MKPERNAAFAAAAAPLQIAASLIGRSGPDFFSAIFANC
jgi:hypothetical protein